jgi:hypothetical protein
MPPGDQVQQLSYFGFLFRAGGLSYLLLGLALSVVGVALIAKPRFPLGTKIYACLSPLPGLAALLATYSAYGQFSAMAMSSTAPKPAEIATVAGYAMSSGFFGILGTILPMAIAMVAISRSQRGRN